MDIYQIFVTHNPAWTRREILFFLFVLALATVWEVYLVSKHKIKVYQAVATLMLLTFIAIVYASTVFTRNPMPYARYMLKPFWSYEYIFSGNKYYIKECFLNFINFYLFFHFNIALLSARCYYVFNLNYKCTSQFCYLK